jgi:hypothetical protein
MLNLNSENSDKINFKFYINASLIGAFRVGICLFIEHPFESIKTQWQDRIDKKNAKEIVNFIYQEKGILGFYRGFLPNFVRVTSKQFYRWPMMLFFPRLYEKYLPGLIIKNFKGMPKILTGLTIANIEIFFLCPLDRLKIFLMTNSHKNKLIGQFFSNNKNNLIGELFRGLGPSFYRSNVSWVSFLYLDHKFKLIFREYRGIHGNELLSFSDLLIISIFVGCGNLLSSKFLFYYIIFVK